MSIESNAEITVRGVTRDDRTSILELIAPFVEQQKLLPRTFDELEEFMQHGFVAVQNGQIVGFAALEIYSKKLGEIRSLAVSEAMQGKGLGKILVDACIDRAREFGVYEVMAISSSENFFRSCGFDFTLPGEKKAFFLRTRDQH